MAGVVCRYLLYMQITPGILFVVTLLKKLLIVFYALQLMQQCTILVALNMCILEMLLFALN